MARTSKRKVRLESQLLQENVPVKTYMSCMQGTLQKRSQQVNRQR